MLIIRRAHWVYSIPKIMLEFVKVQFAKTNPELSEIGKTFWVMNAKDRSLGLIIDKSFFLKTPTDGASLISGSRSFHSDKQ